MCSEPELSKCAIEGAELQFDDKAVLDETDDSTGFKCQTACDGNDDCEAWVVNIKDGGCTLFQKVEGNVEDIKEDKDYISGFKECASDSKCA